MSSINDISASPAIENSERNEHCTCEQQLQNLTKAIDRKMVDCAKKTESKSSSVCIYRVPEQLRKLKRCAYAPRLVSIGPLHSQAKHILKSPLQNAKWSYAHSLFHRMDWVCNEEPKPVVLLDCVCKMKKSLDKAKKCYAEEVGKVLNEEMLVIDGCFVLELLYRVFYMDINQRSNDPILGSDLMSAYVKHDLLLLENQLPFFVLQKLFHLTMARIVGENRTLIWYVISYFSDMWNSENNGTTPPSTPPPPLMNNHSYYHILHILHHHFCPDKEVGVVDVDRRKSTPSAPDKSTPSASDLDYAGVKFEHGTNVRFKHQRPFPSRLIHRARFEIPMLHLYDSTEPFWRNLIAFEQCHHGNIVMPYFTSYAVLMDTLISTPKDVQVLEKAGIIHNHLGASEDATNLFNNLCKEIVVGEDYFAETLRAAAQYRYRFWADITADLKRKYFASPWTFIAFCAGFITFGITVLRFIRSDFH